MLKVKVFVKIKGAEFEKFYAVKTFIGNEVAEIGDYLKKFDFDYSFKVSNCFSVCNIGSACGKIGNKVTYLCDGDIVLVKSNEGGYNIEVVCFSNDAFLLDVGGVNVTDFNIDYSKSYWSPPLYLKADVEALEFVLIENLFVYKDILNKDLELGIKKIFDKMGNSFGIDEDSKEQFSQYLRRNYKKQGEERGNEDN